MQNYAATSSSSSSPTDLSSTTTWIDSVKESWYASEEAHYASDGDYDRSDPLPPPKDGMGNPAYETGHFSAMGMFFLSLLLSMYFLFSFRGLIFWGPDLSFGIWLLIA